jgi:hypothetical protein
MPKRAPPPPLHRLNVCPPSHPGRAAPLFPADAMRRRTGHRSTTIYARSAVNANPVAHPCRSSSCPAPPGTPHRSGNPVSLADHARSRARQAPRGATTPGATADHRPGADLREHRDPVSRRRYGTAGQSISSTPPSGPVNVNDVRLPRSDPAERGRCHAGSSLESSGGRGGTTRRPGQRVGTVAGRPQPGSQRGRQRNEAQRSGDYGRRHLPARRVGAAGRVGSGDVHCVRV